MYVKDHKEQKYLYNAAHLTKLDSRGLFCESLINVRCYVVYDTQNASIITSALVRNF
jgi:hypothetical protein